MKEKRFQDLNFWGGYLIDLNYWEFWQGEKIEHTIGFLTLK